MVQKTFRLSVSRLPGESFTDHNYRQRHLAADIKGHGSAKSYVPQSPEKLSADLIKRESRRLLNVKPFKCKGQP